MLTRNDPCWCGSGKKYKKCHLRQDQAEQPQSRPSRSNRQIIIKTPEQVQGIRECGTLVYEALDMVQDRIEAGVTTNMIDEWIQEFAKKHGVRNAPLNYKGFPKSVCTSINHVICHGIPDETELKDGDIINVDVTFIRNGYYGDSSRMFMIGNVSDEARKLVQVTKECLDLGIQQVRPGTTIGDIGHVIETHAHKHHYSVVEDFAGHGTGVYFHEPPQILHTGRPNTGTRLVPNMIFTIEPMINIGRPESKILSDGWTAVTRDGKLSAQWEHTLLVTDNGYEILTAP